jgi:AGZA family xanthine/uracil permease-like MFS transporter
MINTLERYFGLRERGSTWRIEILAGVSTFLALSYIFIVNPAILAAAGISTSVAFFATIVGSVVATLLMGLWARLPFAVAPGLEMNAYIAYVVVGVLGFSWQGALGAVFWSGVLTVALSYTTLRVRILQAIPNTLKSGLAASVGVFLMLIALKVSNLLVYEGIQVKGIGILTSKEAIVFYVGLALAAILHRFKVRAAIILSIIGAAIVAHFVGVTQVVAPIHFSREMFSGLGAFDWRIILNPKILSVVFILFVLDFYGSIAKFIGLTRNTPIVDKEGNLPRMREGLVVDGLGTVIGAATGTSNLITYVESAVGIGAGGRTGIVAVVVAVLMACFLFLVPVLNLVPVIATTGALLFVGLLLMPRPKELKAYSWQSIVAVLAMILVTIWTFGLDKAMFAGFAVFLVLAVLSRKWKDVNVYLVGSTLFLLVSILLSL